VEEGPPRLAFLHVKETMAETKKRLVERLFTEHGGVLQAFLSRRVRRHVKVTAMRILVSQD
jgi:hypothetical protein